MYPVHCGHVSISHINVAERAFAPIETGWCSQPECKEYIRKYLGMLLIAEINENPAWMASEMPLSAYFNRPDTNVMSAGAEAWQSVA